MPANRNDPELLKILALCLVLAIIYGVLHDQVTARIYPPYFNEFHPDPGLPAIFHSADPTILGFAWGIAATSSVGLLLGVALAFSARLGPWPAVTARRLIPPIVGMFGLMALAACLNGWRAYYAGRAADIDSRLFHTDLAAHQASYLLGILGAVMLCGGVVQYRKSVNARSRPILNQQDDAATPADRP